MLSTQRKKIKLYVFDNQMLFKLKELNFKTGGREDIQFACYTHNNLKTLKKGNDYQILNIYFSEYFCAL